jgi:hypothetical protein
MNGMVGFLGVFTVPSAATSINAIGDVLLEEAS